MGIHATGRRHHQTLIPPWHKLAFQVVIGLQRTRAYEWHDDSGNWFRSYGNENWEFGEDGLMHHRHACINDLPIKESDRKFHWPLGRRPDGHAGLSDLGL